MQRLPLIIFHRSFEEIAKIFQDLKEVPLRVVILSGKGNHFTSGLDCKLDAAYLNNKLVNDAMQLFSTETEKDNARVALELNKIIEVIYFLTLLIIESMLKQALEQLQHVSFQSLLLYMDIA